MGHLWAKDLGRYYFRSTGIVLFAVALLAYSNLKTSPGNFLVTALGCWVALASLQSYLRSREHAADFLAAQVLGAAARDALIESDAVDGNRRRLFRTHPTLEQRREAFGDPAALFTNLRLPMFAFGYLSVFAVDRAMASLHLIEPSLSLAAIFNAIALPASAVVGLVIGGVLAYGVLGDSVYVRSWFRALFLGESTCLLLFQRHDADWKVILLSLAIVLALAKVCGGLAFAAFYVAGRRPERLGSIVHKSLQAIGGVTGWLTIAELSRHGALLTMAKTL
jgi:hypothetical protein